MLGFGYDGRGKQSLIGVILLVILLVVVAMISANARLRQELSAPIGDLPSPRLSQPHFPTPPPTPGDRS